MPDDRATEFSHLQADATPFVGGGLRDFFLYRDLGIAQATHGRVIAHLVRANLAPETSTGWARFMYEDKEYLVEAGDCVHQKPGIVHYLFDYSPDMEYLEIVSPADFGTVPAEGPCPIPKPTGWPR
jgi:hypothetical protein